MRKRYYEPSRKAELRTTDRALKLLEHLEQPIHAREVADVLAISYSAATGALCSLLASGKIQRVGLGSYRSCTQPTITLEPEDVPTQTIPMSRLMAGR